MGVDRLTRRDATVGAGPRRCEMTDRRTWTVELTFTEDETATRADALLRFGSFELSGWGRARRNPVDPDVPAIGEELAAARALSELSHHLLHRAADAIEEYEGAPVSLDA
jgi:hypothetical protein